jgi:myo-inositol 2-dehydrogenase/D-chiro-inositol 1-dehydrogenase
MDNTSAVRVGVIGVGGMGSFHARTLAALANVDVVAVADPYQPSVDRLVDELGCRGVSDPNELAVSNDVDAVVIASPDDSHADLAIAALGAGHWVLCEKPLATTLDDCWRVVDAEQSIGERRIQLGFMREYDPAHTQLIEQLADSGAIEAMRLVHRNVNTNRRPIAQIIGQSMVHDIHSVRFISGEEIVSVSAFGAGASNDSYRHTLVVAQLASGAHAMVEFDDAGFAYEVTVEVLAAKGDVLTGAPTRAIRRRNGGNETYLGPDWFGWFADAYRIQDRAWIESIRAGVATGPGTWDGLMAHAVVEAALESLRTGRATEVAALERPSMYA